MSNKNLINSLSQNKYNYIFLYFLNIYVSCIFDFCLFHPQRS